MTAADRIRIGELWLAVASVYGRDIPRIALKVMLDAVQDMPADSVASALSAWIKDPNARSFPTPGQIREKIMPTLDAKDLARETALRIRHAVGKFGWPNPRDAADFIGPDGWSVVMQYGGWQHVCENLGTNIPEASFIAQCRDAIESRVRLQRQGIDVSKPSLDQAASRGQLESSGEILKKIGLLTGNDEAKN